MQAGLGDINSNSKHAQLNFQVYIANRPPMAPYDVQDDCQPMMTGEIAAIGQHTGNHWRKVFNVYAKLMFECLQRIYGTYPQRSDCQQHFAVIESLTSWQAYRDQCLLQANSGTSLLFTPPTIRLDTHDTADNTIHIVMGKGYAQRLGFEYELPQLLDHHHGDFAVYEQRRLILCPYFDYRQLSNEKISVVVDIILRMLETKPEYNS